MSEKTTAATKKAAPKTSTVKTAAAKPATKKTTTKIDPILRELLEAGAHFGHQTARWNPKMGEFIYTARGGVHILDLTKTAEALKSAEKFIEDVTKRGGNVLFVGTKRQAKDVLAKAAAGAEMPYVNQRWLGGMLTNLETIRKRVLRMKKLRSQQVENDFADMSKKDRSKNLKELENLEKIFGGVVDMDTVPAALFVVDMPREDIAIAEAHKLGIPVVAICDTNADPDRVEHPIPANDDAIKAVTLITTKIAEAARVGHEAYRAKAAKDADMEAAKVATKEEK
ncbi:30S ribosomal protein S2 [Candidatus Saccharibacteria bacterium]|nr:30S ribosomal protein S2 [Candidatus Saccharibacteria bacterium]